MNKLRGPCGNAFWGSGCICRCATEISSNAIALNWTEVARIYKGKREGRKTYHKWKFGMKLLPRTQLALKSRSFITHIDFSKTFSVISEYLEFSIGMSV